MTAVNTTNEQLFELYLTKYWHIYFYDNYLQSVQPLTQQCIRHGFWKNMFRATLAATCRKASVAIFTTLAAFKKTQILLSAFHLVDATYFSASALCPLVDVCSPVCACVCLFIHVSVELQLVWYWHQSEAYWKCFIISLTKNVCMWTLFKTVLAVLSCA